MADLSRGRGESAPGIAVLPLLRTGAGTPVMLQLRVVNHAPEPRILSVTVLGVDPAWLPLPVRSRPIMPGTDSLLELPISPAVGTVPARYPLAVAVQALDPVNGNSTAPTAMAEVVLVVDAPGQVSLELQPADTTARFGRKISLLLRNTAAVPVDVTLDVQSPASAHVHLDVDHLELPANSDVTVAGRIKVRPRLLGHRERHAYTVTARSTGAPRYAEGAITERAILGPGGAKFGFLAALLVVWLVAALVLIPKFAQSQKNKQIAAPSSSTSAGASSGASGSGAAGSGAAGGGAGASSSAASGGSASGSAAGTGIQLNGSIVGNAPDGVDVAIKPTSLVDEEAEAATPVGLSPQSLDVHGMVSQSALLDDPTPGTTAQTRSMVTGTDGSWSFPGVNNPGYFLLTFAKPGYQTQRYVVNSAEAVATQPLKVDLVAGQGSLSGVITGPGGAVGGAQITITDGTNTLTTSTTSTGSGIGDWSMTGLSTPSTYLVTATKDGLSTESVLVPLAAGGTGTASLTMKQGAASLTGNIQGADGGLGGATVTATNAGLTRTATTVTAGPVGNYTLPDLPAPGTYTVTIAADGYQPQTGTITLVAGQSEAQLSSTLSRSTATVSGKLTVPNGNPGSVGLILSNSAHTYKILGNDDGTFAFNGVAPGDDYVLSASLFGYVQQYESVPAVVAGQTTTVDIGLVVAPNGGLPSTAEIRVQGVQDSRTSGQIVCTDTGGTIEASCHVLFFVDPTASTTCASAGSFPVDPGAQVGGYVIPVGLAPGLHKLMVCADGYEPVTVSVQVPVGPPVNLTPTVTVPTVTLYPAPHLLGTITTYIGSAVGVCVVAVAVPANNATPATPTTCAGNLAQASVDATTGAYNLELPKHGTYDIFVISPTDLEYVGQGPLSLTFGLGENKPYSTALHRLGRVDLTLLGPGTNGLTSAPDGTVVTISPAPVSGPATVTLGTGANGQVTVKDLAPGNYTFTATVGGTALTGTVSNLGYDQELAATMLPSPLPVTVGQVVSVIDGTSQAVPNASITISGIIAYNGSSPVAGPPVTITADANGCFALSSTGSASAVTGGCSSGVQASAVRGYSPVYSQISAQVSATGYQNLTVTSQLVNPGVTNSLALQPNPVSFSGKVGVTTTPTPSLSGTRIQVTRQPAGTGGISVNVQDDGTLVWTDSEYTSAGLIRPGSYTLVASLAGYSSASITFTCQVNTPCAVAPGSFVMQQFGGLTVRAVDSTGSPISGANFTVTDNGTNPQSSNPSGTDNFVTFSGLAPNNGASPADAYAVTIHAPGYVFASFGSGGSPLKCPATAAASTTITITPGATTDCTATLTLLGSIAGTLSGAVGSSTTLTQPLNGATVTATKCLTTASASGTLYCKTIDTSQRFSTTTSNLGAFVVTGSAQLEGLEAGTWLLTGTSFGYQLPAVPTGAPTGALAGTAVSVPASPTGSTPGNLTLTPVPVDYTVTVNDSSGHPLTGLTVSLTANGSTLASTPTGSTYVFSSVLPGTYSLGVSGPKVATSSTQVTVAVGQTGQTFTVSAVLNTNFVTGTITAIQGASSTAAGLPGAAVVIGPVAAGTVSPGTGTDGQPLTRTTGADGSFTYNNVPDGTFDIQISLYGYTRFTQQIVVNHSQPPILPVTQTLARVTQQVEVTVTAATGDNLAGWVPTLTATDLPNATLTGNGLSRIGSTDEYQSTFNTVPFGCWAMTLALPANHYGTVTLSSAPPTVAELSCAATSFTVPGAGTADVTAGYTLNEEELDLSVTATPIAPDVAITTADVSISSTGGSTVPDFASFAIGTPITVWVKHATYTVTATPADTTSWPAQHVSATTSRTATTAATVALTEAPATMAVTLTGATAAAPQVVTLTFAGQSTATVTSTSETTNGPFSFSGLAPGSWTVTATAGALTSTKTVTLTSGASTPVTLDAPA